MYSIRETLISMINIDNGEQKLDFSFKETHINGFMTIANWKLNGLTLFFINSFGNFDKYKLNFKNNLLHGKCKTSKSNTSKSNTIDNRMVTYVDGIKEGLCVRENLTEKIKNYHKNDKFDGECVVYHKNSLCKSVFVYIEGIINSEYKKFNFYGNLIEYCSHISNSGISGDHYLYDDNGTMVERRNILISNIRNNIR